MLHPLALELNAALDGTVAGALLSDLGKRMYFPRGIISQGAEARQFGKKANATIGMTVANGKPVVLDEIASETPGLNAEELVGYAPTAGIIELRELWKSVLIHKNPLLKDKAFSLPVVTGGVTSALSSLMHLFLDEGQGLITAVPSWDNYPLAAEALCNGRIVPFDTFDGERFNIAGFEKALADEAKTGFARVLLNFPQNPSGYSPTADEAKKICAAIHKTAQTGCKCLIICDDSYFGLNYEQNIEKQSLFAHLAGIHENVLAVKADGATKEDFVWGFRCGFITFASKAFTEKQEDALIRKFMAVIRATYSCSPTPSQNILLKAYKKPTLAASKKAFALMLEKRYRKVRAVVNAHNANTVLEALPFNSGYFMSFRCKGINADELRLKLLREKEIGVIAVDDATLRVAFSSIDEENIEFVYQAIYSAAEELQRASA
jgi:aspartate/methionine/tyrosine aminotransferase